MIGSDIASMAGVAVAGVVLGLHDGPAPWTVSSAATLAVLSVVLSLTCLATCRAWDRSVLGQGSEEFNRLVRAFALSAVVLGLSGLALKTDAVRPWVFGVLPATALVALVARYVLRRVLHRARARGECMHSVLAIGGSEAVAELVGRTQRVPHHGWQVTAVCTSTGRAESGAETVHGVPVIGDLDEVAHHVRARAVRVVAVTPAPGWTAKRLRNLSWELEGSGAELVVDPGLMEVCGPRLHVEPVDGLPLLRVTEPRFSGGARVAKSVFDRVGALLLLVVLAPVFVAVAVLVAADGGPVFFRQTRVGLAGRPFKMIKFRSMVVDADRHVDLLRNGNEADGPLFKLRVDPRTTRVGARLRRWSLDELPQLLNVLAGSMSLVGPRPPLPREVETYSAEALRKLLVRPGVTGMWQVSGRSDLSWEDSLRLDMRYVENWTPLMDLSILWKTLWAIGRGTGAY